MTMTGISTRRVQQEPKECNDVLRAILKTGRVYGGKRCNLLIDEVRIQI